MKKLFSVALAVTALTMASPALAADLDINLGLTATVQSMTGDVTQIAASGAGSGDLGGASEIASTAVNAAQLSSIDMSVVQGAGGSVNGNGHVTGALQELDGNVSQGAISLAAAIGETGNGVSISSTAANLGQSASVNVRVRQ